VDLADGTNTPAFLRAQGLSRPFYAPSLEAYPPELRDKDGYWAATNLYFMTLGYNTSLVPKGSQPKTYDDLLDPKWKGKMGWSTSAGSGGPGFVGNILETMGQDKGMEYLTRLAQQDIRNSDAAARAVLDMAIAGEFPIALQIFNHHAVISAQSGAPVDWQPLEPVLAQVQGIALARNAPHPHAALLFLEFVLAENEGQKIMRDVDYLPAHPRVEAKVPALKPEQGHYKANFISPERAFEKDREWDSVFQKLFVR
jgi:iron(III) transport system substrate-binding protein